MIRVLRYDGETGETRLGDHTLLADARPAPGSGFTWVDLDGEAPAREREIMLERFGIAALAADDAQRPRHPPKIEWFEDHVFLLLKGFTAETDSIDFDVVHISMFMGDTFLLTRHAVTSPSIDRVWAGLADAGPTSELGPDLLMYRIVRTIIDRYTPIILSLETRLELLEDTMLEAPSDEILAELVRYNSQLKKLRRIFNTQQVCLADLETRGPQRFAAFDRHAFQDLREQMERLASLTALLQELARDLIDGYISVSAHRLNNIMKILTIASVIFLPLTFLAGIYGMNFEHMPELHSRQGYYVLLSAMAVIALVLLYAFRRFRWL